MRHRRIFHRNQEVTAEAKLVGSVMGIAFGGIGLALLIFLWGSPFGKFGSPPLFFRVFGSFFGLVFCSVGVATVMGLIRGKRAQEDTASFTRERGPSERDASSRPGSYSCHRCGAPMDPGTEVSPRGDVKCRYCNSWFNIHEES